MLQEVGDMPHLNLDEQPIRFHPQLAPDLSAAFWEKMIDVMGIPVAWLKRPPGRNYILLQQYER